MNTGKEITPHELIIVVDQGRIVNAVMDSQWNVIEQEPWEISGASSDGGGLR